jgi:hypothetical protein
MKQRKKQVGARWIAKVRGAFLKGKLPEHQHQSLRTACAAKGC